MFKSVPGCIEGIPGHYGMFGGIMGCSRGVPGLFQAVPGCSGGVPGVFRGVPGMFRGVPGCSGCVPGVFRVLQTPVLQLYLFPLLIEVACFVIKSAIIIFVFLLHKSTKVCLHL